MLYIENVESLDDILRKAIKPFLFIILGKFYTTVGDSECLTGSCTNGKCQIVEGRVECVCDTGFVRDSVGACLITGNLL